MDRTLQLAHHPSSTVDEDLEALSQAVAVETDPYTRADMYDEMVLRALPLADSLARRYAGRGIDTDDLVQVARMAVVKAVRRYRPGGGHGFSAYAIPTVSGELKRCFRDQGWTIRPPRRLQELRARVLVEEERLRHALMRQPDDDELAAVLGCGSLDVKEARACAGGYHPTSIDAPTPTGGSVSDTLAGSPCPSTSFVLRDALRGAVRVLSDRQRLVLQLRFGDELTQGEIGERIGVSQMQVSRILRSVIDQLRSNLADPSEVRTRAS